MIRQFFRSLFNPAPDALTPEQEARIAAQRERNTAELGDSAGLAQRYGLNHGQYNQAVIAWRQEVNLGRFVGSLEQYIKHRLDSGIARPGA